MVGRLISGKIPKDKDMLTIFFILGARISKYDLFREVGAESSLLDLFGEVKGIRKFL